MNKMLILLLFASIFFIGIATAQMTYNNPSLPKINTPTTTGSIVNIQNINTSLNGSFWTTSSNQNSLTGTKTGNYNLSTSGYLRGNNICYSNGTGCVTFNTTYNNLLNQNCPINQVVNGTYINGTIKCINITNLGNAFFWNLNQSQNVGDQRKYGTIVLADINKKTSVDVNQRRLYKSTGNLSINYESGYLYNVSNGISVNYFQSWLLKPVGPSAGLISYNWKTQTFADTLLESQTADLNNRIFYSAIGEPLINYFDDNGTYFYKNVNIRGDEARTDDTTLFIQSPDTVDTCEGDFNDCTDMTSETCSYIDGCSLGVCVDNPSLDCTTLSGYECYDTNFQTGACQYNTAYYNYCIDIPTEVSCYEAGGFNCYWDGYVCNAYDGYFSGFCDAYNYDESGCSSAGCTYDYVSSLCTQPVYYDIFTDCANYGSCADLWDEYYCTNNYNYNIGCDWDTDLCSGYPYSTSCSQIATDSGYCYNNYTNGFCSLVTTNDLRNTVMKQGAGQTEDMYQCQLNDGTPYITFSNDCTTAEFTYLKSNTLQVTSTATFNGASNNVNGNLVTHLVYPSADGFYDLGRATNKYNNSHVKNMFAININATNITIINVTTKDLNASGITSLRNTTIVGNLNQTSGNATINGIYGGIYYHNDSGGTFPFASEDVFYNFTYGNCGVQNGFICNSTTGTLTAQFDGVYKINYIATGTGVNNHLYHIRVAINDIGQNNTESHGLYGSGTTLTLTGMGHIRINATQRINLQIEDSSGTGDGTVYNWNFVLERIGN